MTIGPCPPWWRPFARRRWKRQRKEVIAQMAQQIAERVFVAAMVNALLGAANEVRRKEMN